jgi:hypothetical protein
MTEEPVLLVVEVPGGAHLGQKMPVQTRGDGSADGDFDTDPVLVTIIGINTIKISGGKLMEGAVREVPPPERTTFLDLCENNAN